MIQTMKNVFYSLFNKEVILYDIEIPREKNIFEKEYLRVAEHYLSKIRDSQESCWASFYIETLRENLQKGNGTLEEIGSSEKEIEELQEKIHLFKANQHFTKLKELQKDSCWMPFYLEALKEELQAVGKTLEDIGMSEK